MRIHTTTTGKFLAAILFALALFSGGYLAGQNKFGQPKTVLHLTIIKWNSSASDADKERALQGVKEMAAKIPGIKNVWIKADRIQPRDFNAAFAIEFKDRDAADNYAESPIHKAWSDQYQLLRAASISEQITNP
ncbi:MAG TPA: Dabb family protein [Candidatus Limnocylindria bacterium]|nr:Dabb family protein [Candidatus Limnocylindria bacterium]